MKNKIKVNILAIIMASSLLVNTGALTLAQVTKNDGMVEKTIIDTDDSEQADKTSKIREGLIENQLSVPEINTKASQADSKLIVQEATSKDLKSKMLGEGMTLSNFKIQGADTAFGVFSNGANSLGIDEGVVMSTGKVTDLELLNSATEVLSNSLDTPRDDMLNSDLDEVGTRDATVIEFDFVPKGENVEFEYIFGSEEYNTFVGDKYKETVSYFLDGENIAGLPSTESMDSNLDGLTTILPVQTKVTPGKTHHMELVIADAHDNAADSAVFIKANSFSSPSDEVSEKTTEPNISGYAFVNEVSYLPGGGIGTPPLSIYVSFGDEHVVEKPTRLSKPGHVFTGWLSSYDGKIYQAGTKIMPKDYIEFTAQWKAVSGNVTISYQDTNGKEIVGAGITNEWQPIDANVSYPVPDLSPDYVLDKISGASWISADKKSFWVNVKEGTQNIVLTYIMVGKVNVKYVDENRQPITPPAGTNAPVLLRQEVGKSLTEAVPNFLPLHEIAAVEGATLSADKKSYVINKFTEADQTVTLVYKEIPQEVKMTIKYLMDQTKNNVVDLATQVGVPEVEESVTIGQPISSYSDVYQRDIDGYTYKSVTGNKGNVPKEDFTVTYYYEGKLGLENVPKVVDFGQDNRLITVGKQKVFPVTPIQVDILDTRDSNNQSWQLQLKVLEPIQTADNQLLKGSLKFNQGGNIITLTETGQVVKNQGIKVLGREKITWSTEDGEGLYLEQEPGNLKDVAYKGKVSWQLTDGL